MTPTPTPTRLGEREAVARTEEACSCCGLTIEECSERYMLGIEAKEALQADADLWPVLKANFHLMHAKAFEQGYLAGRAKFDPLRTENETLRAERDELARAFKGACESRERLAGRILTAEAERDAAIARTQEAARELAPTLGQLRHLYPIVRRINEELADGLLAPQIRRLEKIHLALTEKPKP